MNMSLDTDPRPENPIAAVTHRDPYPYYFDLVANKPLYRDERLGMWVASSAHAVTAALTNAACRVRPSNEPVPPAIIGSPAEEIFRRLVRMNDGAGHCSNHRAIVAAFASVGHREIAERTQRFAKELARDLQPAHSADGLHEFAFRLSPYVIGDLLGIPPDKLKQTAQWVGEFVRCVFPGGSPEEIEHGKTAAERLLALFRGLLVSAESPGKKNLLAALAREAHRLGSTDSDVVIANGIGLLSQAYDATAGLIGNTLLALAAHPELRDDFANDFDMGRSVIREVLRLDPPIHNTRRFVACDTIVAGQRLRAGDKILVVLAAANRDPAANANPDRFDAARRDRCLYTFGAGAHACPGDTFAVTIAQMAVRHLIDTGLDLDSLTDQLTYRPSANARIPMFSSSGENQ